MHVGRKRKLPETREDKNPGHRFSWIFLLYFWLHHHKERRWVVLHAPEGVCVCVCVCVFEAGRCLHLSGKGRAWTEAL